VSDESNDAPALARLALASGVVVVAMIVLCVATSISQAPLTHVHVPEYYAAILRAHPQPLRALFALDSLFAVLYGAFFLGLGARLARKRPDHRALIFIAAGLLAATALADLLENLHIVVMLSSVEEGLALAPWEIVGQAMLSGVKYHLSYAGLFGLGLFFPRRDGLERTLRFFMVFVYPPLGFAISVLPEESARLFVLLQALIFVASFFAFRAALLRESAPE
jgi:hypothetical protein